ncbi:MAG: TonB-dependent receptor, partial [Burkholderiaceae bacterium]
MSEEISKMALPMRQAGVTVGLLATAAFYMNAATAQTDQALDKLEIIGTTPLPGANVPRSAVPANVQSTQGDEIDEQRSGTLAEHFNNNFSGVYVNEAQSNPYQPDLNYRG